MNTTLHHIVTGAIEVHEALLTKLAEGEVETALWDERTRYLTALKRGGFERDDWAGLEAEATRLREIEEELMRGVEAAQQNIAASLETVRTRRRKVAKYAVSE